MDPKVSKKLKENIPEIHAFLAYIKKKVKNLDTTLDIEAGTADQIALEVKSRQKAIHVLVEIMSPLINIQDFSREMDDEYGIIVDIEGGKVL